MQLTLSASLLDRTIRYAFQRPILNIISPVMDDNGTEVTIYYPDQTQQGTGFSWGYSELVKWLNQAIKNGAVAI